MKSVPSKTFKIKIAEYQTTISIKKPENFEYCLIIANGAGGNMNSPFIKKYFNLLSEKSIMTVAFNFHYQDIGKKTPDKNEKCQETYLGVLNYIIENENISEKKIVLAGKSMGGRIATQIAKKTNCEKIIILGYPLHPPGKPEKLRDEHLYNLKQALLFIQGEKDAFGNKQEMEAIIKKLKNAQLEVIQNANHSLDVPKKFNIDPTQTETQVINSILSFFQK